MISKKEIDVISPVYNQENNILNFLELASKFDSNYFNFIFIDDGSSDNSKVIIKDFIFESGVDNFHLVTKENGGAASARNLGLKFSVSNYVWFCDPDDRINPISRSYIEKFKRHELDIILFSYIHINENDESVKLHNSSVKKGMYSLSSLRDELLKNRFLTSVGNSHLIYPWDKIIKRSIINKFFDEKMSVYEDQVFNFCLLENMNAKVWVTDAVFYEYITYKNSTSLSNSWSCRKTDDFINFMIYLNEIYGKDMIPLFTRELLTIIMRTPKGERITTLYRIIRKTHFLPNFFIYKSYFLKLIMVILMAGK